MKLIVRREIIDQHKGFFGNKEQRTYKLFCKLELSEEEHAIIQKFHLWHRNIVGYAEKDGSEVLSHIASLESLYNGDSTSPIHQLGNVIILEGKIIEGCRELRAYLDYLSTFDQETVVEI